MVTCGRSVLRDEGRKGGRERRCVTEIGRMGEVVKLVI